MFLGLGETSAEMHDVGHRMTANSNPPSFRYVLKPLHAQTVYCVWFLIAALIRKVYKQSGCSGNCLDVWKNIDSNRDSSSWVSYHSWYKLHVRRGVRQSNVQMNRIYSYNESRYNETSAQQTLFVLLILTSPIRWTCTQTNGQCCICSVLLWCLLPVGYLACSLKFPLFG